jgi:histidine triad (HIT) family protein
MGGTGRTPRGFPAVYPQIMTVFAKILAGQIPCHKIYEDAHVLAFLDVFPTSRGHTLVIPKEPAETLDKLSDESGAALGRVLPRIARAVMKITNATAFNVLQNNGPLAHQAVFHVHFHIIPKYADNPEAGLGIQWPSSPIDHTAAAALAKAIAGAI